MRTLSSLLVQNFQANIKAHALARKVNGGWKWTTRETLLHNVYYCREILKQENINRGDRVAYKGDNSVEWVSWNVACNSLGAVWVPMYANQNMDYCNHVLEDSGASVCITDDISQNFLSTKTMTNSIVEVPEACNTIEFVDNDIATLIYTSGTTGSPKGVMLSNENILSNIDTIQNRFHDMQASLSLNILPWAHIYSQTCELYYNLLNDNRIAIASSRENFIKECGEIQPESLYIVPRVLEMVKSKLDIIDIPYVRTLIPFALQRIFGSRLQVIFTGGAKLQPETREFFKAQNILICEGYGSTELSPMVCVNHMNDPRNEESIGKLLDGIVGEIVDGELQIAGPNVMQGYWGQAEATEKVLVEREGKTWYKTGDAARLEDGYVYYEGRIGDNYKLSNGKFVNVDAVEAVVKKHIKGMVVVFGENKDYNELITDQMIPPRGGGPYLLDEINQELESYLKIKQVHYLPTERWAPFLTPKMSIKRKALVLNSL
jgi:long-chain acyl-CoA synthetase